MSIPFNSIPGSLRLPGARFEINSGERPYQGRSRLLFIAPKLASGTASAGVPIRMPSDPIKAFGAGSIAAEVAILARRQAPLFELWMLPVADPAGTASTARITIDAVPDPGAYRFFVFGRERFVTVTASDTTSTLATKIAAAATASWFLPGISTRLTMPVTAVATAAVTGPPAVAAYVTLTSRHTGTHLAGGGWVDFALAYDGPASSLAAAVTVTYPVAGTGDIDMAAVLAGLGALDADWIGSVFDSSSARTAIDNLLADRWGPIRQQYGIAIYANQGSYGALAALGTAQNTFRAIQVGQSDSAAPKWAILAQAAAAIASYWDLGSALSEAQILARPAIGTVLRDLPPPRSGYTSLTEDERQALYFDGVAPLVVNAAGQVTLELVPTMYRTDANGLDDTNFLWVNYPLIYVYFVRFMRNFAWSRHANTSAVGDAEPGRPGQTRPSDLFDTFVLGYLKLRNEAGIVEDVDGFIRRLQVERSSDPARFNVLCAVDAANPFHVLATNVQASSQFQT